MRCHPSFTRTLTTIETSCQGDRRVAATFAVPRPLSSCCPAPHAQALGSTRAIELPVTLPWAPFLFFLGTWRDTWALGPDLPLVSGH